MEQQVAVLIDGDNISPKYAEFIKREAMRFGRVKICRLYGSVSSPTVKAWYHVMPLQGITPVLQISYANGKSIADQALTIDAMDILHSGEINVICIVSSDCDYTKLAYRIKEAGILVVGMGEQKTNESLAKACDEFKVLDLLYKEANGEAKEKETAAVTNNVVVPEPEDEEDEPEAVISIPTEEDIIADIQDILDDDWENLGKVGNDILRRRPGFDVRIYGYRNISAFIRKHRDIFEIKKIKADDKFHDIVYIRKRPER